MRPTRAKNGRSELPRGSCLCITTRNQRVYSFTPLFSVARPTVVLCSPVELFFFGATGYRGLEWESCFVPRRLAVYIVVQGVLTLMQSGARGRGRVGTIWWVAGDDIWSAPVPLRSFIPKGKLMSLVSSRQGSCFLFAHPCPFLWMCPQ